MSNMGYIKIDDLVDNPTPRVPVCLCLDVSGSMGAVEEGTYEDTGETVVEDGQTWQIVRGGISRISELQKGIELFFDSIRNDEVAVYSAEISIVVFNDRASCLLDFSSVEASDSVPKLEASGTTAMGEGVNLALDLLEKRKNEYKDKGVDYYQPWLVLMTDGEPNGSESELKRAIDRTVQMVNNKKLTVFSIGIGKEADMAVLNKFSPKRSALRLKGLKFAEFFEWLSSSVSQTSSSIPGENVKLDTSKIMGWGDL